MTVACVSAPGRHEPSVQGQAILGRKCHGLRLRQADRRWRRNISRREIHHPALGQPAGPQTPARTRTTANASRRDHRPEYTVSRLLRPAAANCGAYAIFVGLCCGENGPGTRAPRNSSPPRRGFSRAVSTAPCGRSRRSAERRCSSRGRSGAHLVDVDGNTLRRLRDVLGSAHPRARAEGLAEGARRGRHARHQLRRPDRARNAAGRARARSSCPRWSGSASSARAPRRR